MQKELSLQIDQLSNIPLYEQIEEQLKQQILTGELEEHSHLPSVRALAQTLGISVITTRRAYTELEAQGYVITVPAKGTFVSYRFRDHLKKVGISKLNELVTDIAFLAKALQIDKDELLAQVSSSYEYVQDHEYSLSKARQVISQFVRK